SLLKQLYKATYDLTAMANTDGLTGVPNRRLLEDRIEQAIKNAKRSMQTVAILFLDLDAFKVVNDSYGHAIGDLLLKSVAERLQELMRAEDTIARIGGDEFVVLLPRQDNESEVVFIAERIIEAMNKPFDVNDLRLNIGVSIGVALYPAHADDLSKLIRYADSAMYCAKQRGGNCYAIYNIESMKETA
ncbi:MAG: diguanylate cyclase, partial [Methylophilus sp.]